MLEALAAIVRALLYAGILSCAGSVFAMATLRAPSLAPIATQIIRCSAWLTIIASLASALILVLRLGEFDEATLSAVFISSFGAAVGMQLAGSGLLLASLDDPTAQIIRVAHAALMTLSFALSGHAPAADLADGLVVFIHASTAAWWIGSLWLLRHACRHLTAENVVLVVNRFSRLATSVIGGLTIAGLVLIRELLNFANMPRLSPYEKILLVKLSFVVVVVSVAVYNKFKLSRRIATGDTVAMSTLRKTITVELVLIGVVLAVTAILTTYTSPPE